MGGDHKKLFNAQDLSVQSLFSVESKVAVVTGGLRGIGLCITNALVANGAKVYALSRRASDDDAKSISGPGSCIAIAADLSTEAGCIAAAKEIAAHESRVHVLVNNAGATWGAAFEEYPDKAFDKIYAINVKSVFFLTRALRPLLLAAATDNDPARVVNIGSIDGIRISSVPHYAYSASKAAVHMLTRVLASEFAPHVTVNAVAAGSFATKMMAGVVEAAGGIDVLERGVPLHRSGRQTDIGGLIIYLASAAGSWCTGAILPLDGGLLVKKPMASL